MPADTPATPARRTRLTPERERELFTAVVDLVREQGYDALTMDAVAARTKSSKATLYRQWESKPKLVASAMRHLAGQNRHRCRHRVTASAIYDTWWTRSSTKPPRTPHY